MGNKRTLHPEAKDELLTVLADHRRRAVLAYFRNSSDDVASVQDLANELKKHDHRGDQPTLTLLHSVLPRLANADVIDYDGRSDAVRYRGDDELERLAAHIAEF